MAITITAKRIDSPSGIYERKVVSLGESKVKKAREIKELSTSENSAKIKSVDDKVIVKASGDIKSELLEGAVYSLHINLFENSTSGVANNILLHESVSLGEIKKISDHITVSGDISFEYSAAYTSEPTGTVTLANIANMAVATDLFPHLEYEFNAQNHYGGLNVSGFATYLKETWLPANLPEDMSSVAQDTINIL